MLRLVNITKDYKVADTTVQALKGIDVCFRENEFVSVLGPSGCGKTTLLNLIGGLDHYTAGDMSIYGRSTKEFKDHDWDVYRNHRIGFIFQGYNLIPHQTVLGNVELALTIAGLSKAERVAKAKMALDKVGLTDQYYKRPNQLSGGQCQRVAIARALVNDPDILLADEPTGALDTVTSKQIMDLVKEIAKERLVIMVTHNSELADEYSTRIIKLLDGNLLSDSNPFGADDERKESKASLAKKDAAAAAAGKVVKKKEKAQMSFWTAFKLSLQNLFTKKKRTAMTSIAGSIGIIGVSMVLSISYGVQSYINNMQNDMLSGNPIEIAETALNINLLMNSMGDGDRVQFAKENGWVNIDSMVETISNRAKSMANLLVQNNITQDYVDFINNIPAEYLSALYFDYGLDVSNNIYTNFRENAGDAGQNISLSGIKAIYGAVLGETDFADYVPIINSLSQSFTQAPDADDYILSQYNLLNDGLLTSRLAKEKNEVMVVLGKDRILADLLLAQLGYYTQDEFVNIIYRITEDPRYDESLYMDKISYGDLIGKTFTWYPNDSVFTKVSDGMGLFSYDAYYCGDEGVELTIVGILEPNDDLSYGMLSNGFYYTADLAEYITEQNKHSGLAEYLRSDDRDSFVSMATFMPAGAMFPESPETIIYTGITFEYEYYSYLSGQHEKSIGLVGSASQQAAMMSLFGVGGGSGDDIKVLTTAVLSLQQLGGNIDADGNVLPSLISVYPLDFTQKDYVLRYLDQWNSDDDIVVNGKTLLAGDREEIIYTDALSLIISMIKSLLRIITVALVGFTSLSLVVSCVMIAIITYVSVVERIKEIGVIRSLGGRKRDVSNLFTAETVILGLVSGLIGIFVTYLLSALINLFVSIAVFPWYYAAIMVCVSVGLTLISGFIPSRSAAKKDPAVALRTE